MAEDRIVKVRGLTREVLVLWWCNPSNMCAAFYTISTDSVLACFLCISRASCQ